MQNYAKVLGLLRNAVHHGLSSSHQSTEINNTLITIAKVRYLLQRYILPLCLRLAFPWTLSHTVALTISSAVRDA